MADAELGTETQQILRNLKYSIQTNKGHISCNFDEVFLYRVAPIFPEHFQSFTIALKNHIFH